ncbi:MAG: hypothetical protein MUC83_12710 [Pirellula sp.]|nr:hypothetical protein [Pirellula sp.]
MNTPTARNVAKRLVRCGECSQILELPPDLSIDQSICPCCHAILANSVLCTVHSGSEQQFETPSLSIVPPPPPPLSLAPTTNSPERIATEHGIRHDDPSERKRLVLIWSLGALAVGLLLTLTVVFSLMSTQPAPAQASDSKELIEMIKDDVAQMQAKVEEARQQLELNRVRNAQLEKERTRLQIEVSKLEEANSF